MNVNLEDVLRSAESSFSRRANTRQARSKRCPQCDDDEIFDARDRLCRTCGEELIDNPAVDEVHQPSHGDHSEPTNFFDLIGDDLRREIQDSLALSLPDRQISIEYLSKLGKVVLDSRRGLLHDITLSIGPLSIMCVLASFGAVPVSELAAKIIFGDPEWGDTPDLSNAAICYGTIVVLKRGKVSFAQKAIAAKKSGAR